MNNIQNIQFTEKRGKLVIFFYIGSLIYGQVLSLFDRLLPYMKLWLGEDFFALYDENIIIFFYVRSSISAILNLVSFGCLLFWFSAVYDNFVRTHSFPEKYPTKRIAILYWLIPILNLFRPYQMLNKIMKNMDSLLISEGKYEKHVFPKRGLIAWWGFFLYNYFFCVLFNVFSFLLIEWLEISLENYRLIMYIYGWVHFVFFIIYVILTFLLIRSYTHAEKILQSQSDKDVLIL